MSNNFNYFTVLTKINYNLLKCNSYLHFSYTDLQNEHFQIKTNKFLLVFHAIFMVVFCSVTFSFFISLIEANTFFVAKLITLLNAYFTCSVCIGVIFWSHVIKQKMFLLFKTTSKLNEYLRNDKRLKENGGVPGSSHFPQLAVAMISVEMAMFLVTAVWLTVASHSTHLNIDLVSYLILMGSFIVVSFSQSVSIAMFVIIYMNASEIFETVNRKMAELLAVSRNGSAERKLRLCARLHLEACELTRIASGVTAFPCLLLFTSGFLQITLQCYSNIIWMEELSRSRLGFVFVIATNFYRFGEIIVAAEKAKCACIGTRRVLQQLMVANKQEKSTLKEIRLFFMQLLHYEARISPGGLFDINYAFGLSIVAGIVTYLIILIQTDPFASQRVTQYIFKTKQ